MKALETLGKLKEVNGNVRTSIDKLEDIQSDLVRTDDDWQTWDFPTGRPRAIKFIKRFRGTRLCAAVSIVTERNTVHTSAVK